MPDPILDFFLSDDPDLIEAAEVAPAPVVRSARALAAARGPVRIELPLGVVHLALEGSVAAALDISASQLDRVLAEDLALDAELVTWELEEAPEGAGTGMPVVHRVLDGRTTLTEAVPLPAHRSAQLTDDARGVLVLCAQIRRLQAEAADAKLMDAAHQQLWDAVWMLVHNVRQDQGPPET